MHKTFHHFTIPKFHYFPPSVKFQFVSLKIIPQKQFTGKMAEKNRKTKEERYLLRKKAVKKEDEAYGRFGYHPYAAVIHGEQVPTGGGLRPFHYHIVMRKNF